MMMSRKILAGLACGAVVALSACGAPSSKDAGTGGGTGGSTTGGGTGGATGGGTGGGATGGGTAQVCTKITTPIAATATAGGSWITDDTGAYGGYAADVDSPLAPFPADAGTLADGGLPHYDYMEFQYFWALPGSGTFPHTATLAPTTIADCFDCIYYYQDCNPADGLCRKTFLAMGGNVNYTGGSGDADGGGTFVGGATNLHFERWNVGQDHSVDGGGCYDVTQVNFNAAW